MPSDRVRCDEADCNSASRKCLKNGWKADQVITEGLLSGVMRNKSKKIG